MVDAFGGFFGLSASLLFYLTVGLGVSEKKMGQGNFLHKASFILKNINKVCMISLTPNRCDASPEGWVSPQRIGVYFTVILKRHVNLLGYLSPSH